MNNKLYVGNLPETITDEDLKDNFGDLGTCLTAHVICDKQTKRSRGFAFVEMATEDVARQTIEKCKGVMLGGQKLVVKLAHSEQERQVASDSRRQR